MEIDPNDIVFEEDSHTYTRNGANYISVTTLLKKYNLSAHYSAQIPPAVLAQAAQRGTNVHKSLEEYIKNGVSSIYCDELTTFFKYVTNQGIDLTKAISEEVVYNDTYLIAGTIDFQYELNGERIIADFKTTSSIHWEAVAWQLSIYNYMKCRGDLFEYYSTKLMVYHMRGPKLSIREVPLIDFTEVEQLLKANLFNAPYVYTPDITRIITPSEGVVLEQLVEEIYNCKTILLELEAKKKKMQDKIINNMTTQCVASFNTDNLKVTYSPSGTRETIDSKKLKEYCEKNNIDMTQFITISNTKETIRITPKKDWKEHKCITGVVDPLEEEV